MLTERPGRGTKKTFFESAEVVRLKLAARLYEVSALLGTGAEMERIREGVREIRALHRASPADLGLLGLLLDNLARDLSAQGSQLDSRYYAAQLAAAADRISPR